jgi:hypothetical protein
MWNWDLEAFTSNVGLSNKAPAEKQEQAQGHVRNRFECPSPSRQQTSACLAKIREMGARTNRRGNAAGVAVLWWKIGVVAMKNIQNRHW